MVIDRLETNSKETMRGHPWTGVRRGPWILLVDKDLTILDVLGDMLAIKEYQVSKARDGLEALERFRKSPIDLMIFELVLPKIDGHDLCRLIRQEERGHLLPLIALTALAPGDIAKLPGLSADAYVAKGSLATVIPNILDAIKSVLTPCERPVKPAIYGYEMFHPHENVSELLAWKRYYQRLFHAVAEVVIELDPRGKILSANCMALRLLGRPETEITGLPLSHLLSPPDGASFQNLLEVLLQDLEGAYTVTEVALAGERHLLRCRPVSDSGAIVGFLVTAGS